MKYFDLLVTSRTNFFFVILYGYCLFQKLIKKVLKLFKVNEIAIIESKINQYFSKYLTCYKITGL